MHEFASHELSLARDHMMLLGRLSAEEKIAAFVWRMRQRWARVEGHAKLNVPLPMSRQDIADYLGLTLETVSRAFSQLKRDGVLAYDRADSLMQVNLRRLKPLTGTY